MSGPILAEVNRIRRLSQVSSKPQIDNEACKLPLSELPFDPTIGAEQLAHAKQRIRDQRREIALLEAHIDVMKEAMARRQDILDYVRQAILHDSLTLNYIHDDGKRQEYQKMFMSILDGDTLHGMSASMERQLLGDQLVALNEKVRLLDARDATKSKTLKEKDQRFAQIQAERDELSLQLSRAKSHHANLYRALQETKQDLSACQESLSQAKRESEMLRKTLDATLQDMKAKESQLSAIKMQCKGLQDQIDALASQSESEKAAAMESLKVAGLMGAELGRLSDLSGGLQRGTQPWQSNLSQMIELSEKARVALSKSGTTQTGEIIKPVVRALQGQLQSLKHTFQALQESIASSEAFVTQLSLSTAVQRSAAEVVRRSVDAFKAAPLSTQPLMFLTDLLSKLRMLKETSPISVPCAQDLVAFLVAAVSDAFECLTNDRRVNGEELRELLSRPKEVPPPPPPPGFPIDQSAIDVVSKIFQGIRSVQESNASKLFPDVKGKQWEEHFAAFIDDFQTRLTEFGAVDPKPAAPPQLLAKAMEIVTADLSFIKSAKRDLQRALAREKTASDALEQLRNAPKGVIPTAPPDPMQPLLDSLQGQAKQMIGSQRAALECHATTSPSTSYLKERKRALDALRDMQGTIDCNESVAAKHPSAVFVSNLISCVAQESEEVEALWRLLVAVDSEVVVSALTAGSLGSDVVGVSERRSATRALAVEIERNSSGLTPLSRLLVPPTKKSSPKVVELSPPARLTGHRSVQTDALPRPKEKEITLEEAISIVKKSGKWPAGEKVRIPSAERGSQAAVKANPRSTQTAAESLTQTMDKGVITDASLLSQYLGGTGDGGATAATRTRGRVSIVHLFGDQGELEQVGNADVGDVARLGFQRTASSIPSRRQSVDSNLASSIKSSSVSLLQQKKHSIGNLLEKRQSMIAVTRELADSDSGSDESVVIDSLTPVDAVSHAAVPSKLAEPPVSHSIFNLILGDDFPATCHEAPADFYTLLKQPRPMSATSFKSTDRFKRPESASSMRSKEVRLLYQEVKRRSSHTPETAIAARNKKIIGVVEHNPLQPISTTQRRESVRQLARSACGAKSQLAAALEKVRPMEESREPLEGW